jgi:predicted flap endonuclease-1-like 5' DNA nuclease
MSSTSGGWINLLIVWGIASAVGFVSMAALMLVGDWSVMQALFAAAVIFLGLGIILSVLFLNPLPGPQVPGSAGKKVVVADRKPAAVKPVANPAPAVAPAPAAAPAAAKPKKAAPTPATAPAPAAAPAGTQGPGKRPAALSAARDNRPDDLKRIKGIGPKLEKLCNSLGFYHFDQIAAWSDEEIAWVDQNLEGFKGRVVRDTWVAQAKELAREG